MVLFTVGLLKSTGIEGGYSNFQIDSGASLTKSCQRMFGHYLDYRVLRKVPKINEI